MIDLHKIYQVAVLCTILFLLGLWQLSEHRNRQLLAVAETATGTSRLCVTSYGEAVDSIGAAIRSLRPSTSILGGDG